MFLEILAGEEARCKPLWRVFRNACGWSREAFGWCLVFLFALQGDFCYFVVGFRGYLGNCCRRLCNVNTYPIFSNRSTYIVLMAL